MDFGKPFNKTLARVMIGTIVVVWIPSVLYVAFAYDRPILKSVGFLLLFALVVLIIIRSIRLLRLNPKFRITANVFQARDVGPIWKVKKYELRKISEVRKYSLPYVGFKYKGKRVFFYVPLMGKRERGNLTRELELAANKSLNTEASDAGAA